MDQTKIKTELNQYIKRLEKKIHPKKVLLYGSFARGTATDYSDIDILVIADFPKMKDEERFDMLYDLHKDIPSDHDFHVYGMTQEEYQNKPQWTIVHDIKKEAILVTVS